MKPKILDIFIELKYWDVKFRKKFRKYFQIYEPIDNFLEFIRALR